MEPIGRPREAALLDDGHKVTELPEFHYSHPQSFTALTVRLNPSAIRIPYSDPLQIVLDAIASRNQNPALRRHPTDIADHFPVATSH